MYFIDFSEQSRDRMSVSYKMTLTRSWGNETKALGNKIQSVQKWLLAGNGNNLATGGGAGVAPAFNYILMRGLYRITFVLCDMGKCIKSTFWKKKKLVKTLNSNFFNSRNNFYSLF